MAPRWAAQTRRNGSADDERPEELRAAVLTVAPFDGDSAAFYRRYLSVRIRESRRLAACSAHTTHTHCVVHKTFWATGERLCVCNIKTTTCRWHFSSRNCLTDRAISPRVANR